MLQTQTLEEMRDLLLQARATGTRAVQFADGKKVEYKSDAEMAAALADLEARIARASTPRQTSVLFIPLLLQNPKVFVVYDAEVV